MKSASTACAQWRVGIEKAPRRGVEPKGPRGFWAASYRVPLLHAEHCIVQAAIAATQGEMGPEHRKQRCNEDGLKSRAKGECE